MTASPPPSLPRALNHWRCGCGRLPSRSADTTRDAYCDEAKFGRLNRSADMFVLAVVGTVETTVLSSSQDRYMTLGWDNPTADPTITILLRHGDTRLSPEHRFSGVGDLSLSPSGI